MGRKVSIETAASHARKSSRSIYRAIKSGELTATKSRVRVLLDLDDLDAWIARNNSIESSAELVEAATSAEAAPAAA